MGSNFYIRNVILIILFLSGINQLFSQTTITPTVGLDLTSIANKSYSDIPISEYKNWPKKQGFRYVSPTFGLKVSKKLSYKLNLHLSLQYTYKQIELTPRTLTWTIKPIYKFHYYTLSIGSNYFILNQLYGGVGVDVNLLNQMRNSDIEMSTSVRGNIGYMINDFQLQLSFIYGLSNQKNGLDIEFFRNINLSIGYRLPIKS